MMEGYSLPIDWNVSAMYDNDSLSEYAHDTLDMHAYRGWNPDSDGGFATRFGFRTSMPCVAHLVESTASDETPVEGNRHNLLCGLVYALRPDNDEETLEEGLRLWNNSLPDPLPDSELDSVFDSLPAGYRNRCLTEALEGWCDEDCPWSSEDTIPYEDEAMARASSALFRLGHGTHLKPRELTAYAALGGLETRAKVKPGTPFHAKVASFESLVRLGAQTASESIDVLVEEGFILMMERGEAMKKAKTVARIYPPPLPQATGSIRASHQTAQATSRKDAVDWGLIHTHLDVLVSQASPMNRAWRGIHPQTLGNRVFDLAADKARGTADYMRATFSQDELRRSGLISKKGNLLCARGAILIPFVTDGAVVNIEFRPHDPSHADTKSWFLSGIPTPVAYNINLLDSIDTVVLCEGAIDTLSALDVDVPAIGLRSTSGDHSALVERLAGKSVAIALDADKAGTAKRIRLIESFNRVGIPHTIVPIPDGKDLNDLLIEDRDAMREMLVTALRGLGWEGE